MNKTIGACYLGRNVSSTECVLLRFANDMYRPGVFVLIGPYFEIPGGVIDGKSLLPIFGHLRSGLRCDSRKLSEGDRIDPKDLLKLKRRYIVISIFLYILDDGSEALELISLHGGRGWNFKSDAGDIHRIALPVSDCDLIESLNKVFELAT